MPSGISLTGVEDSLTSLLVHQAVALYALFSVLPPDCVVWLPLVAATRTRRLISWLDGTMRSSEFGARFSFDAS